jgi:oxaloacetate decarboxylase (Na+ extruding) subunit alpha
VGARSREVTDEVLLYALGFWGDEEAQSIDANLKDRLLGSPRAKELARIKPPDISIREFRERFAGKSDDDRLLIYFAGADAVAAMRAAGAPGDYAGSATPLVNLIEHLTKRKATAQVSIKRGGLSVRLERRQRSASE